MATLTIRNVDDATKRLLRIRAAQHGVSMEEEARRILRQELSCASSSQFPFGQHLLNRQAKSLFCPHVRYRVPRRVGMSRHDFALVPVK